MGFRVPVSKRSNEIVASCGTNDSKLAIVDLSGRTSSWFSGAWKGNRVKFSFAR